MKKLLVTCIFSCSLCFGQASIEISDHRKHLGSFFQGEHIDAEVLVTNVGKDVLEIQRIQPTCDCMVSNFPLTVEPGKSGTISVSIDTTDQSGKTYESITILSNDHNSHMPTVLFQFTVIPIFSMTPPIQSHLVVGKQGTREKEFFLTSNTSDPFSINDIEISDSRVKISTLPALETMVNPAAGYKLWFHFSEEIETDGELHCTFEMNHPKRSRHSISFIYQIKDYVYSNPASLEMHLAGRPSIGELTRDYSFKDFKVPAGSLVRIVARETWSLYRVEDVKTKRVFGAKREDMRIRNSGYST